MRRRRFTTSSYTETPRREGTPPLSPQSSQLPAARRGADAPQLGSSLPPSMGRFADAGLLQAGRAASVGMPGVHSDRKT